MSAVGNPDPHDRQPGQPDQLYDETIASSDHRRLTHQRRQTYDTNSNVASINRSGRQGYLRRSTYEWPIEWWLPRRNDALNPSAVAMLCRAPHASTDANGHTTSFAYDPLNRLGVTTDARGRFRPNALRPAVWQSRGTTESAVVRANGTGFTTTSTA